MNSSSASKKKTCSTKGEQHSAEQRVSSSRLEGQVTRHTYYARVDLLEKVHRYAYWERYGISELINQILEEFFEDKEVKPEPRRKRSR